MVRTYDVKVVWSSAKNVRDTEEVFGNDPYCTLFFLDNPMWLVLLADLARRLGKRQFSNGVFWLWMTEQPSRWGGFTVSNVVIISCRTL